MPKERIKIVNVTGKIYADKTPTKKKRRSSCKLSLRATTVIIFVCIGIIYVAGSAAAVITMRDILFELDQQACNESIDRFSMLFYDDIGKTKRLSRRAAWSEFAANAAQVAMALNDTEKAAQHPVVKAFVQHFINTTTIKNETTNVTDYYFDVSQLVNYWGIFHPYSKATLWSEYHAPENGEICTFKKSPRAPFFQPPFLMGILANESSWPEGWVSIYRPAIVSEIMIITIDAIRLPDEHGDVTNSRIYGYLMVGRNAQTRMSLYADETPGCMSMISKDDDWLHFDKTDNETWDKGENGSWKPDHTFAGTPAFTTRDKKYLENCSIRVCPKVPLFNATDQLMTGYFQLCGLDPKVNNRTTCMPMRLDRPMSMLEQGTTPIVLLCIEVVVIMIILFTIFVIFLDCAVLRRVDRLSNVIREQTRSHQEALEAVEEQAATQKVAGQKIQSSRGKRGKSSRSTMDVDHSRTNTSSDVSDPSHSRTRDEIGNLKRAMEQNALGLRKRLEGVNDSLKNEQQKALHHRQAMELLNVWCGRYDFFPGLRPNAMLLRYEPPRSLDDLLTNPIAIEYLKSHCDNESTLDNLWFLLDVSFLQELETAEDEEEDADKRQQIHDVASATAMTIVARYIAVDAPQQINISANCFQTLREKASVYERGMFEIAVTEVKLMLNTDILPRFQKSAAYPAMSETLFINNSGDGDDSEFSDETMSTAGSILLDPASEVEVGPVFAHTFKNLNTDFEIDDGSSTRSGDSSHATMGTGAGAAASLVTTTTGTGTAGQAERSSKDGSSVSGSDIHDKKKLENEKGEPEKEEEKPDSSSNSSDSSSSSFSSGSMTMSDESD